jgi:hypothetical protein
LNGLRRSSMSELHDAFPPIPVRDPARIVCVAVAMLGLVLCSFVIKARMPADGPRVAVNVGAQTLPSR